MKKGSKDLDVLKTKTHRELEQLIQEAYGVARAEILKEFAQIFKHLPNFVDDAGNLEQWVISLLQRLSDLSRQDRKLFYEVLGVLGVEDFNKLEERLLPPTRRIHRLLIWLQKLQEKLEQK
ncbi:MAG: hypothetical protein FJ044_02830 [Candidatus Cloacimonetes bacterium]|nr:hypothetical protein [Candidatus Cloacimonadota bacterium]